MNIRIATIYCECIDSRAAVMWDDETKKITYHLLNSGEIEDSDEEAETLAQALSDTHGRYCPGWDLEWEDIPDEVWDRCAAAQKAKEDEDEEDE